MKSRIRASQVRRYALLAGAAVCCAWGIASARETSTLASPLAVHLIQIDDQIINPVTADYIISAIDQAEAAQAQCLVIELDTPGGLLESTRTIVKRMLQARVPLVVYVSPDGARAGSAGVFITLASHVAAMAPTTNIGAAHPVTAGGGGGPIKKLIRRFQDDVEDKRADKIEPRGPGLPIPGLASKPRRKDASRDVVTEEVTEVDPMSEKILHDTVAWITAIAQARGRNVAWARQSVEASVSITAEEAVALGVVDLLAHNITDLLTRLDGRTVQMPSAHVTLHTATAMVKRVELTRRQRILLILSNPTVAYLLMMLGFWGLVTEITHPGLGFPGIAGAICLIVALYAFQTLPINYAGVALIVIGLALLAAEVTIVSYGLLALGGIVCLTLGSVMLIDSPHAFMRVSLTVIIPIVATTAGMALFLVGAVIRTHRRHVTTGQQGMIGAEGVAHTDLNPEGHVFLHGEVWQATATQPVKQGQKIRVTAIHHLTLTVQPL